MHVTTRSTGAKINLFLRITGVRDDGYHLLESLFLPIPEPRDVLTITGLDDGGGLAAFSSNLPGLDAQNNTVVKAYRAYADATGFAPPVAVDLHKGIPAGAGLGGGSADAALLLNWLQEQNPEALDKPELNALAVGIGADVPFFLDPRPSLVTGIGEIIEPLALDINNMWLVLLCPDIFVSTARAFQDYDRAKPDRLAGNQSLTESAPEDKNHRSHFHCPPNVANSLEPVVFKAWPVLAALKGEILATGAQAAGMSGSGSSLFGVFSGLTQAEQAAEKLRGLNQARVFGPFLPGR